MCMDQRTKSGGLAVARLVPFLQHGYWTRVRQAAKSSHLQPLRSILRSIFEDLFPSADLVERNISWKKSPRMKLDCVRWMYLNDAPAWRAAVCRDLVAQIRV
jgi:hypothetical protein